MASCFPKVVDPGSYMDAFKVSSNYRMGRSAKSAGVSQNAEISLSFVHVTHCK